MAVERAKHLVEKYPRGELESLDTYGYGWLHWTIINNQLDIARLLIDHKFDVNIRSSTYTAARSRKYNRRQLYEDISVFLKRFGLYLTKELELYIIHNVLKDDSRHYRKLRIQKRTEVGHMS